MIKAVRGDNDDCKVFRWPFKLSRTADSASGVGGGIGGGTGASGVALGVVPA